MTNDRPDAPTGGHTYNGFAGPPADGEPHLTFDGRPPPAPRSRDRKPLIVAGVAAALGLGVIGGLLAQPRLAAEREDRPMAPVGQIEIADAPEAPPEPLPASAAGEPLEVLPPEYAAAAQARAAEVSPRTPAPALDVPPPAVEGPTPEIAVAPPPPRAQRPSFDCADAGSRAERMVCEDPELAAADRRLSRAFRRAADSGVPFRELRAEQDDWLDIREDAARHSRDAVASVYAQRIDELNAIAREGY